MSHVDDTTDSFGPSARRILRVALDEQRAAELLRCLFDNGSATVDPDGNLVLATMDVLNQLGGDVSRNMAATEAGGAMTMAAEHCDQHDSVDDCRAHEYWCPSHDGRDCGCGPDAIRKGTLLCAVCVKPFAPELLNDHDVCPSCAIKAVG